MLYGSAANKQPAVALAVVIRMLPAAGAPIGDMFQYGMSESDNTHTSSRCVFRDYFFSIIRQLATKRDHRNDPHEKSSIKNLYYAAKYGFNDVKYR